MVDVCAVDAAAVALMPPGEAIGLADLLRAAAANALVVVVPFTLGDTLRWRWPLLPLLPTLDRAGGASVGAWCAGEMGDRGATARTLSGESDDRLDVSLPVRV